MANGTRNLFRFLTIGALGTAFLAFYFPRRASATPGSTCNPGETINPLTGACDLVPGCTPPNVLDIENWICIDPTGPMGATGPMGPQGVQGVPGPQGVMGLPGAQGPQGVPGAMGAPGVDGNMWYDGTGIPAPGLGLDNDYYLDGSTGDYYLKSGGVWMLQGNLMGPMGLQGVQGMPGAQGPQGVPGAQGPIGMTGPMGATGAQGPQGVMGLPGTDGSQWFTGSGAPMAGLGVDGDFYLDSNNGDYYEKIVGSWTLQGNLTGPQGATGLPGATGPMGLPGAQGPQGIQGVQGVPGPQGVMGLPGADGSQWFNGSGSPAPGLGVNGDYYLDDGNGDYYAKIGGVWTLQGNLTGATGPMGLPGSQGPQGMQGATGLPGADGSVWHNGSGVPAPGLGVNGDYYLDDNTGDYYTKIGGVWTLQGNLQGPAGAGGGLQVYEDNDTMLVPPTTYFAQIASLTGIPVSAGQQVRVVGQATVRNSMLSYDEAYRRMVMWSSFSGFGRDIRRSPVMVEEAGFGPTARTESDDFFIAEFWESPPPGMYDYRLDFENTSNSSADVEMWLTVEVYG